MIAIINVDTDLRSSGPHLYEIRINRIVIATFIHNREDALSILLERAAAAVSNWPPPSISHRADAQHATRNAGSD